MKDILNKDGTINTETLKELHSKHNENDRVLNNVSNIVLELLVRVNVLEQLLADKNIYSKKEYEELMQKHSEQFQEIINQVLKGNANDTNKS